MALTTSTTTLSRLISLATTPKPSLTSFKSTLQFPKSTFISPISLSLKPARFSSSSVTTKTGPITATIAPGQTLPESTFSYLDSSNDVQTITTQALTASKTTILFAVPGAFTPTCSQKHVPSFLSLASDLKSKGVSTIACISINDAFVMKAWKESLNVGDNDDRVLFLSDVNGDFTKAIGAELDLTDKPVGLGVRSRRYAMIVVDGVVKKVHMEEGGAFTFSGAEDMLKEL